MVTDGSIADVVSVAGSIAGKVGKDPRQNMTLAFNIIAETQFTGNG